MREYLFRGNRKDNGEWIEGYVFDDDLIGSSKVFVGAVVIENNKITGTFFYEVIPETVGQFTGLTDKNGKKIFEGDIVHAIYKLGYTGIPDKDFGIGVIRYNGTYYGGAAYQIDIIGEPGRRVFSASLQVEVIGNIHDNPELLKGGVE